MNALGTGLRYTEEQINQKAEEVKAEAVRRVATPSGISASQFVSMFERTRLYAENELRKESRAAARSPLMRREVLASGLCAYCGDPRPNRVDHIVPIAQFGTGDRENFAPACNSCNSSKNADTPEQWMFRRFHLGLCWPPRSVLQQSMDLSTADSAFRAEVLDGHGAPADWVIEIGEDARDGYLVFEGLSSDPAEDHSLLDVHTENCVFAARMPAYASTAPEGYGDALADALAARFDLDRASDEAPATS